MDTEMDKFQANLLESVRQMKGRETARITRLEPTEAAVARDKLGMSQSEFATLLGVSVRTYRDWEQGRRNPTGAAQTLLRVAVQHPEVLQDLRPAAPRDVESS
ncbi:XRE family transcriptional regulator [Burkholderia ubonensis]|uniref:helix-turn-helix domain-containing protein n=1 Tax=Burkholderia ubonensis TaxID=101571 RepID=UPI0007534CA3|nr:helix-turn-helix domain-containing protein [Burkholderia ubonensis]KVU07025.1 XRE family transcriptional regulator [Burkholderia ubonensis]KVU51302.1 XRE family transcriptional regulator [Burkholderia ubonensis]KVU96189.1 XRE family transcriptional regulator [Burkholderia ubonensis]